MDRAAGAQLVKVKEVGVDRTPFRVEYEPGHPAADKAGYASKQGGRNKVTVAG